jgi:hypothetical protein
MSSDSTLSSHGGRGREGGPTLSESRDHAYFLARELFRRAHRVRMPRRAWPASAVPVDASAPQRAVASRAVLSTARGVLERRGGRDD